MILRGLFLLIMCMFTNSVTIKENSSTKEMREEKNIPEARYHFNHPPSADYYNPIPVAVVYEDGSSAGFQNTGRSEIATNTENVQKTTIRERTTTAATRTNKAKLDLIPKPRALNDFQIPVAVVYESESNSYHRTKTDTNIETPKRHVIHSRKQQPKITSTILNDQTQILKVETEKPDNRSETRTFRKRTGSQDPVVPILESENYVFSHTGNFRYRYEGGDGTIAFSEGKLKTVEDETGEAVVGGFSYKDKDGNDFSLSYTADENGYRPLGAHLPTPPPIPPAIARALKYLATATPEPVTKRPVKSDSLIK